MEKEQNVGQSEVNLFNTVNISFLWERHMNKGGDFHITSFSVPIVCVKRGDVSTTLRKKFKKRY